MKKLVTILAVALVSVGVFAQSPQKMSYQAIVRNSSNVLVTNTLVSMKISILQGSGSGSAVYVETHTPTTNVNGLVSIEVGAGTVVSGTFSTISWANGPFYIKTATDPTGGTSYSITGTSQLLSVPYALYAAKSGSDNPWLTVGNSLTTVGLNFLGTTDLQPLMFKVNNVEAGYIDYANNKANTGFGFQTLISNTTGYSNTANGYNALQSNTTGVHNSALGRIALSANTEGNNNVALGSEALSYNTTGSFNVAAGSSTMRFNTSGNYNTANGIWALYNNTLGSYNSAYGTSALQSNIDGNNNTAVGYNADVLTGNLTNATAIGNGAIATANDEVRIGNVKVSSLYFGTANNLAVTPDSVPNMFYNKTTGQIMRSTAIAAGGGTDWHIAGNALTSAGLNFLGTTDLQPLMFKVNSVKSGYIDYDNAKANTFLGFQTGFSNTGFSNTAVGYGAFVINVAGHQNTALGYRSLYSNTTGNANAANGMSTLFSNTTGSFNTATGTNALFQNTTGHYNTANGNMSLGNTGASDGNTALGYSSGDGNVNNGNNNTFIGTSAAANASGFDNATALGYNALVAGSNNMILGNNNVNVGIGLSGLIPQNKLEINTGPSVPNASGLRFRQLTSTSTQTTPNPGTGVLSVNTYGDVILVPGATGSGSLTPGTTPGEMLYWNGTAWVIVAIGTEGQVLTFCSGVPTWGPCTTSSITPVTSPTGKIWMDRNLGATQAATSSTDAASYGDLYQWGRLTDGHQIRISATTVAPYPLSSIDVPGHPNFILSLYSPGDWRSGQNASLWQGITPLNNNPCPTDYRIPTSAEFTAEIATFSPNTDVGAFASPLKLPLGGSRNPTNGSLVSVGSYGLYWSSTVSATNSIYMDITSVGVYMLNYYRAAGYSVRCIHN